MIFYSKHPKCSLFTFILKEALNFRNFSCFRLLLFSFNACWIFDTHMLLPSVLVLGVVAFRRPPLK